MEFLHRDEFEKRYDRYEMCPVVMKEPSPLEVVITREEISSFDSLDDLIKVIQSVERGEIRA